MGKPDMNVTNSKEVARLQEMTCQLKKAVSVFLDSQEQQFFKVLYANGVKNNLVPLDKAKVGKAYFLLDRFGMAYNNQGNSIGSFNRGSFVKVARKVDEESYEVEFYGDTFLVLNTPIGDPAKWVEQKQALSGTVDKKDSRFLLMVEVSYITKALGIFIKELKAVGDL